MTAPLNIAVAGAGLIGLAHIARIRANPACMLSAIVDPAPASQAIAKREGVPHFAGLDALLAQHRPDGIVLATPNQFHLEHTLRCIAAGVPALLEKPIAPTIAEGEEICAAIDAAHAKVLIGHHRAHSSIMARAKQLIDSGALGTLVAVMGSAVFFKPDHYFEDGPWRRLPGGGPILINMIHEVHNLRMLCGEIVAVQSLASNARRQHAVEDTVAINLRFANGVLGTFMLSDSAACARSWEQTSQENADFPSYTDEDCYVIAGTGGSLSIPTMRLKTYDRPEDRSWWKPFTSSVATLQRDDPLVLQLAHFVDVIRGVCAPKVSARDGLANLRIVNAITEAARTGHSIQTVSEPL
jgi:predicted dehydrogenase